MGSLVVRVEDVRKGVERLPSLNGVLKDVLNRKNALKVSFC